MLNKSGEGGHPCVVSDLRGNAFNHSPVSIMVAVGLLYIAFIVLMYASSIPDFFRVFVMKGCCIMSNAFFFASIEKNHMIFIFHSIHMVYDILLNHPCISGINPT